MGCLEHSVSYRDIDRFAIQQYTECHMGELRVNYRPTRVALVMVLLTGGWQVFAQNPATYVAVDADANRHPISPDIYGWLLPPPATWLP